MDMKKPFREVEDKAREAGREMDGHDVSDDIGNAGDEIRKDAGNLGDDLRRDVNKQGDLENDRTDVPRGGAPD